MYTEKVEQKMPLERISTPQIEENKQKAVKEMSNHLIANFEPFDRNEIYRSIGEILIQENKNEVERCISIIQEKTNYAKHLEDLRW